MSVPSPANGHHDRLASDSFVKCRSEPPDYFRRQKHEVNGVDQERSVLRDFAKSGEKGTELPCAPLPIHGDTRLVRERASQAICLIPEHDDGPFEAATIPRGNLDGRATREIRQGLRKGQVR